MENVQNNLKQRNLNKRREELQSRRRGPLARLYDEEPASPAGFPVDVPDTKNLTTEQRTKLIREIREAQA